MRNLKDYLKLIFAAVVCFLMSFVPGKKIGKIGKEVVVNVNGKGNATKEKEAVIREKVTNGKITDGKITDGKVAYGLNDTVTLDKVKTHSNMPTGRNKISHLIYYNTG